MPRRTAWTASRSAGLACGDWWTCPAARFRLHLERRRSRSKLTERPRSDAPSGAKKNFSLEYSYHSPTEQRWVQLTVTPLGDDPPNGAVVMHMDVTAKRQTAERLRVSEWRFRQMADNIRDVFFLIDAESLRPLYISPAYEEIWGRSCESGYANPESWTDAIHPDDRASTYEKYKKGMSAEKFEYQYRIVRPDGSIRSIEDRCFPIRDDGGKVIRVAGVAEDITDVREPTRRCGKVRKASPVRSSLLHRHGSGIPRWPVAQSQPGALRFGRLLRSRVAHPHLPAGHPSRGSRCRSGECAPVDRRRNPHLPDGKTLCPRARTVRLGFVKCFPGL